MTDPSPETALPRLFTVAEVARALQQSERYVAEQARLRRWPHRRFARGEVRFTADDVEVIVSLARVAVIEPERIERLAFAPRSGHRRYAGPRPA